MPTFSRPDAQVGEGSISETTLPMRGSEHSAFAEMRFSWADPVEADPRYRNVTLPPGHLVRDTDDSEVYLVRDKYGYPRAKILLPDELGPVPTISPMRRFDPGAEKKGPLWRMVVFEWGRVITRGLTHKTENEAHAAAEEWLDQYRGGWRSYIAPINFAKPPPS